jgi:hypothetical protein
VVEAEQLLPGLGLSGGGLVYQLLHHGLQLGYAIALTVLVDDGRGSCNVRWRPTRDIVKAPSILRPDSRGTVKRDHGPHLLSIRTVARPVP